MIKHSYSVEGNLDQIQNMMLDTAYNWKPHPKVPNRVKVHLPFDQAVFLYQTMKQMGLVAHKNWEWD